MRVFCFLCVFFVPCLLCVTILAQRYCCWQEAFWTVSKKACASFVDPQHCCREKKWRPWIRQSNRIQSYSFLSSALPPTLFKSPQTHTHTHTPEVWTPRLPSKEANISRTRPFSGETEKYFLMILGFTPFLTERLQMPMVCPGESCSTHVLIVLVGGLLRPHGWQCMLLVFSPHWYAR